MKYQKMLTKNITKLYIVYIIIFSVIAYAMCVISASRDYRHSAETSVNMVNSNMQKAMVFASNATSNIKNFSAAKKYVYADDNDIYRYADEATQFLNNTASSKVDSLILFGISNYISGKICTSTKDTFDIDFFMKTYDIDKEELLGTLNDYIDGINKNPITVLKKSGKKKDILVLVCSLSIDGNPVPVFFLYDINHIIDSRLISSKHSAVKLEFDDRTMFCKANFNINGNDSLSGLKTVYSSSLTQGFYKTKCSYLTSYSAYFLQANSFLLIFVLALVTIIFLTRYMSIHTVKLTYEPIRNTLSKLSFGEEANDEFEIITGKFDDLTKRNQALSQMVKNNRISLADQFFMKILTNTISHSEIQSGISHFGMEDVRFPLTACVITVKNFDELSKMYDTDGLYEMHSAVKQFLNDQLSKLPFFKISDIDLQSYVIVIPFNGYENIRQLLIKLLLKIETFFDIDLAASVGKYANGFGELSASYLSAVSLRNNIIFTSMQAMVLLPDDKDANSSYIFFTPEQENAVINAMLSCNPDEACKKLDTLIDNYMSGGIITIEQHAQLVIVIYAVIQKILSALSKTEKDVFPPDYSVYLELKQSTAADMMKNNVWLILEAITGEIKKSYQNVSDRLKQSMISYIHDNYADCSISLTTLSLSLNISQYYASRQFKQLIGENFKDYLTSFRMNKAIELLRNNPDMKIKDIAETVGYANAASFSRAFAKQFGMIPNEYIKNMK